MDLYTTRFDGTAWSAPVNLGREINSISDEMYPGIDMTGNLFFSSDRKPGSGGHDIFYSLYEGGKWKTPVNLKTPVNTKYDDIAFTPDRNDGRTAFYTVRGKNKPMELYRLSHGTNNDLTLAEVLSGTGEAGIPAIAKKDPKSETVLLAVAEKDPKSDPPVKKDLPAVIKQTETKTAETKPIVKPGSPVVPTKTKTGVPEKESKTVVQPGKQNADQVIYRVQILSNMKPKGSYQISVNNKAYDSFEYLHAGAYRTCIGEFITFRSAVEFQNSMRKAGYAQAFVVAFRNGIRTNEPALFK
jgi:hypothetical protein